MAILTQMAHCLVALYRLSTFESPDIPWDRQRVRQELDLGDIIKLIADRWEQVPAAAGIEMGSRRVGERGDVSVGRIMVSYEEEDPGDRELVGGEGCGYDSSGCRKGEWPRSRG